jgi:hypothetical protein
VNDWRSFYRVARAFRLGTRTFARGDILRASDPTVERVMEERPDLLLLTVTRTDLPSRRPQAGARSSPKWRPSEWLIP